MAFKVTDIINESMDGARASLFMAEIKFPDAVAGGKHAGNISRFLIKSAALPASTLGIIELPFMGRKIKIAGDRTFEDWETTIINDEQMNVRSAIENWSDSINGLQSNKPSFVNSMAYRSTATITQLSTRGNAIRTYKFHEIWPSSIAAIDVAWETTDTIEEFSCTWTYDFFTAANGADGADMPTLGGSLGETLRQVVGALT